MSVVYKLDSIRIYNATFIRTRILLGQDDAAAWALENRQCYDLLVRKTSLNEASKSSSSMAPRVYPLGLNICRNFNEGRCTREHCRYSHISFVSRITQQMLVRSLKPRPQQPTPLRLEIES